METQKYTRKPFVVDVVGPITKDNMQEAAGWCKGIVQLEQETGNYYIKVEVERAMSERQTQAFVGDYILCAGNSFKVYTPKAFKRHFDLVEGVKKDAATQAEKAQPAPVG